MVPLLDGGATHEQRVQRLRVLAHAMANVPGAPSPSLRTDTPCRKLQAARARRRRPASARRYSSTTAQIHNVPRDTGRKYMLWKMQSIAVNHLPLFFEV